MEELKKNTKVVEFIKTKYGKFDDDTLKEFFLSDFYTDFAYRFLSACLCCCRRFRSWKRNCKHEYCSFQGWIHAQAL